MRGTTWPFMHWIDGTHAFVELVTVALLTPMMRNQSGSFDNTEKYSSEGACASALRKRLPPQAFGRD